MTGTAAGRDPVTIGPYRLISRLGEGGMGVVHLALDSDGRAVAIKILRPHVASDEEARSRLGREVDTLRRLRDPRVAEVLDADVDGQVPYLVTRFVPGKPLERLVREDGPLSPGAAALLGRDLAGAIKAIHAAGVIHRDVKPANVMILDGAPVLIDFGIAHVADESRLTSTGLVMGTPGYLSPEVCDGAPVSDATDWWGWGATLAFAVTGRVPFGTGPVEVVLERVRRGAADLDGVPEPMRGALAAALSVDPEARPSPDRLLVGLLPSLGGPREPRDLRDAVTSVLGETGAAEPGPGPGPGSESGSGSGSEVRAGTAPAASATARTEVFASSARTTTYPASAPGGVAATTPAAMAAPTVPAVPGAPGATAGAASAPLPPGQAGPHPSSGHPSSGHPSSGHPSSGHLSSGHPSPGAEARPPRPPADRRPALLAPTRVAWGLLVALSALAAVAPGVAVVTAVAGMVALRTVDRSLARFWRRRYVHGPRRSDRTLAVVTSPWSFLGSVLITVPALILPLVVGVSVAFITGLLHRNGTAIGPDAGPALALGMAAGLAMAWFGAGGYSLRRAFTELVRVAVPSVQAERIVLAVLALVTVSALIVAGNGVRDDLFLDWVLRPRGR